MKLLRPESVEEIEPSEYAENTENQSFWDFYFHFGRGETDEHINIEHSFSDKKNKLAAEKLGAVEKGEAAKTSKTDTNL